MTTQYPIQRIIGATSQCVKLDILVITPLGNRVITRDAAGQQGVHFTLGAKLRNPSCFLLKIQACEWSLEEVGIWFPKSAPKLKCTFKICLT